MVRLPDIPKNLKRWDFLLVDNRGNVISFKHIRRLIFSFLLILIILLSILVFLYLLYASEKNKNDRLQNSLQTSNQKTERLKEEVHDLMVRLARIHSEHSKVSANKDAKPIRLGSSATKTAKSTFGESDKGLTEKVENVAQDKPKSPKAMSTEISMAEPSPESRKNKVNEKKIKPESSSSNMMVGVEGFSAFLDPELHSLRVKFLLKKANRNIPHIAGRIFVILKQDEHDHKGWFTIPAVELDDLRKPIRTEAGQYFKIRNYKTVEFMTAKVSGPINFSTATVLIYTPTGVQLIEKTFATNIKVPVIPTEDDKIAPSAVESHEALTEPEDDHSSDAIEDAPELKEKDMRGIKAGYP